MKLTRNKLVETLRRKNEGWTTYQARKIARISVRRVNQVWKAYLTQGQVPELRQAGRPAKSIEPWEVQLVKDTYATYRVSACMLEKVIDRDYQKHIPHNRIHKILLQEGLAEKGKYMQRKKKYIRYERRHSLTAVHLDWFQDEVADAWALPVIDDASRKLLALVETSNATTDASIQAMKEALTCGRIRQCITDHGTQFIKGPDEASRFDAYLQQCDIQHILCRIKHPQSNGKSEKFNDLYQNHRHAFTTKEAFITWYNDKRPHWSLDTSKLETPSQAFVRKMRPEG